MQQEDRRTIQRNYSSLVERTDLDSMVNSLYERGVFSEQMIEPYRDNTEPVRDRKRKLYRAITKRGPQAFGHLVESLAELGYWDLVRDLDPTHPFAAFRRPLISSNPIPTNREPRPSSTEDFVSISNERHKTKTELQKMSASAPAPAPPPPDLDNAGAGGDSPEIPDIHVVKSTSFVEERDNNDLMLYDTRGSNRGVLVVFTYVKFDHDIEDHRYGAEVDLKMLKSLFGEIGFRVLSYINLDHEQTIATLRSLEDVLVDTESVFIVVSSHGHEQPGTTDTDIRCSDGRLISFYTIMSYFSNLRLPKLIGIPKVFIFQVCRGIRNDYVSTTASQHMAMPEEDAVRDGVPDSAPMSPSDNANTSRARRSLQGHEHSDKLPPYSDILIAHSTLPGCVSYRHPKYGSWYIQALCEVFAARAHDTHVDKLFTLVDKEMRARHSIQTSSVDRWGFNKRLYLHPGLFE